MTVEIVTLILFYLLFTFSNHLTDIYPDIFNFYPEIWRFYPEILDFNPEISFSQDVYTDKNIFTKKYLALPRKTIYNPDKNNKYREKSR